MIFEFGKWLAFHFGEAMPVGLVLALLDLMVNTVLNLAFLGYNTLRIRSFRDRSLMGGKK